MSTRDLDRPIYKKSTYKAKVRAWETKNYIGKNYIGAPI